MTKFLYRAHGELIHHHSNEVVGLRIRPDNNTHVRAKTLQFRTGRHYGIAIRGHMETYWGVDDMDGEFYGITYGVDVFFEVIHELSEDFRRWNGPLGSITSSATTTLPILFYKIHKIEVRGEQTYIPPY